MSVKKFQKAWEKARLKFIKAFQSQETSAFQVAVNALLHTVKVSSSSLPFKDNLNMFFAKCKQRYLVLEMLQLCIEFMPRTSQDKEVKKFLKQLTENVKCEPILFRSMAAFMLAQLRAKCGTQSGNDAAAEWLRRTMNTIEQAENEEKMQVVKVAPSSEWSEMTFIDVTVEHQLATIKKHATEHMEKMTNRTGSHIAAAGQKCDCCDATAKEVGVKSLQCCAKCNLHHCCSKNCQESHWSQHKPVCRKLRNIRKGNLMSYRKDENSECFVGVMHESAEAGWWWVFTLCEESQTVIVFEAESEKLFHFREDCVPHSNADIILRLKSCFV